MEKDTQTEVLADREKRGYYKVGWKERIAFGSGDMAQNFIWITIGAYLMVFYTNVFMISPAIVGTIMMLSRLVNVIWDPIIGTIVDKVQFKFGRYRGWIAVSAIPFAIASVLCFWVPPSLMNDNETDIGKIVYVSITYICLSMIYTTINVPYGALGASITRDPEEVVILSTARTYFANIGRLVVSYGVPAIVIAISGTMKAQSAAGGWLITMGIMAVAGFVVLAFCVGGTKERVTITKEAAEKVKLSDVITALKVNKPLRILCLIFFLNQFIATIPGSAGAYYMIYNVGNENFVSIFSAISPIPPLIILPFIPFLRKKFGKQTVLYIALAIGIVGYAGLVLAPVGTPMLIFAAQFVRASGMVVFGSFIWSLLPEVITYGEWKTGKRVSGIVSAMVGFAFTFATTIAAAVPGYVLEFAGFNAKLDTQPDSALLAIKILLAGLPVLFVFLVIFLVTQYKLTDAELVQMSAEIEAREKAAEDDAAPNHAAPNFGEGKPNNE
jgi:GPH family glycoside/pentoside/hexuronide:cation symporter